MGYREYAFSLPTGYTEEELVRQVARELGTDEFTWQMAAKSLDARKKTDIRWQVRVGVTSPDVSGEPPSAPRLGIPRITTDRTALVAGSGPAGIFAALVLQQAGIRTTLIERGPDVADRARAVREFEKNGTFHAGANYAFGEGGAGTFSDGKLTSRSKRIKAERQFILDTYIRAGAPQEIAYLAHPHLGSDNLFAIVRKLREKFTTAGGALLFNTMLEDVRIKDGTVTGALTSAGVMEADHYIIAPGHSAYETYRMLIRRGIPFRTKNFAVGCRAEHPQEVINRAQWGRASLPGVKAAEYRLTSDGDGNLPVYTFCMCPGGTVVPAAAYADTNIVNGMSRYKRNGRFANAGCVAGIGPGQVPGLTDDPLQALDWLETLERSFHSYAGGYDAPFCTIDGFLDKKLPGNIPESSYPFPLKPAPLWEMLPVPVTTSLTAGLKDFTRKIRGFKKGILLGLESKTSSPIQAVREKDGRAAGFENLYIVGEGAGWAGGIISSAADGIKAAMTIVTPDT